MRIGFDVSQTGHGKAGCGYYAYSLIRELAAIDSQNEYILYPTFGDAYWDPDWPTSTFQTSRPNFRRGIGHRTHEALQVFWNTYTLDLDDHLGRPDIVHSTNFYCPVGLRRARLVYTLYDLCFVLHPEWTTETNRISCFTGVFNASAYADHIIAISDHTRRHFVDVFPHFPPDAISVVYPASRFAGPADPPRPTGLPPLQPEAFWLSVGTIEPRKNHKRLLAAYAHLRARQNNVGPLVLAGAKGWLVDDFDAVLEHLGVRPHVLVLGYVDDDALQWLYENCFAFVYPSLFEGFGLPVLEAMSLGAPVIASGVTSIPEIAGDAALLIDPERTEDLAAAMERLHTDEHLRERLRAASLQRAKLFSWRRAAQQVLDLYAAVADRAPRTTVEQNGGRAESLAL
jgi:glycosyltransferase involved in cell wall biosynthesis